MSAGPKEPDITTPVSRLLGTLDPVRTAAFYRDVLGFQVAGSPDAGLEVTRGAARIRFGREDYNPGEWDQGRPTGSAIVFFGTDDVEALHRDISARGGTPSELQNVNLIKMRMFEVRDPDGHTLWFGQSHDQPDQAARPGLLEKVMPELPLSDVPGGMAHYRDVLGFQVNYFQADIAVMDRDDIRLLLVARTGGNIGTASAYFYVKDADVLHAELNKSGASVQGSPVSQPWGLREFAVLDPEGNRLTFGQPFE